MLTIPSQSVRAQVVAAAVVEKIDPATASTQFGAWKRATHPELGGSPKTVDANNAQSPAKSQVIAVYRPLLLLINAFYVALRCWWWQQRPLLSLWSDVVPLMAVAFLQWYAYSGILEQAADKSTSSRKAGDNTTSLVGGSNLDLLALTILVQYGSLFWTRKMYYLLMAVPLFWMYSLYSTFLGGGTRTGSSITNNKQQSTPGLSDQEPTNSEVSDKRQKRAEKRRKKWS